MERLMASEEFFESEYSCEAPPKARRSRIRGQIITEEIFCVKHFIPLAFGELIF